MTTEMPGRIDIVIFPNGGREVIGRSPAYPPVKEAIYIGLVNEFVTNKIGTLENPENWSGYYTVKDDVVSMRWTPYIESVE